MKHGQYVNPGNSGFQIILNSEYVDKTGLIGQMKGAAVRTWHRRHCLHP